MQSPLLQSNTLLVLPLHASTVRRTLLAPSASVARLAPTIRLLRWPVCTAQVPRRARVAISAPTASSGGESEHLVAGASRFRLGAKVHQKVGDPGTRRGPAASQTERSAVLMQSSTWRGSLINVCEQISAISAGSRAAMTALMLTLHVIRKHRMHAQFSGLRPLVADPACRSRTQGGPAHSDRQPKAPITAAANKPLHCVFAKSCMLRSATWHHPHRSPTSWPGRSIRTRPLLITARRLRLCRRCAANATNEQPVSTLQQFVLWLIANGAPLSSAVLSLGPDEFAVVGMNLMASSRMIQVSKASRQAARPRSTRERVESGVCSVRR